MSLKFVYTNQDGSVSIVVAADKPTLERVLGPLTDEEYRTHVLERSIPEGVTNVREISDSDLPADRSYRNAWCDKTAKSSLDINMVAVKNILLTKLRASRDEKLSKSDSLVARAIESGADLSALKAKRQALRDSTNALKAIAVSEKDLNSDTVLKALEGAVPTLQDVTL